VYLRGTSNVHLVSTICVKDRSDSPVSEMWTHSQSICNMASQYRGVVSNTKITLKMNANLSKLLLFLSLWGDCGPRGCYDNPQSVLRPACPRVQVCWKTPFQTYSWPWLAGVLSLSAQQALWPL